MKNKVLNSNLLNYKKTLKLQKTEQKKSFKLQSCFSYLKQEKA